MRRNFPVTKGRLTSHEVCTECINPMLGNVIKNGTEKESKKSENVNFFTPGIVYIWNELGDILICRLLCFFYGELSTCNKQESEVEECSGALKCCYK